MNINASVTDICEDKRKFEEEKSQLLERLKYIDNSDLAIYTKVRLEVLEALINYINKILGEN